MQSNPSVIIIDDDKDHIESISMFLELKGIEVKGKAYNGCNADKLYQQTCPDVVLLDMNMPDCDGVFALEKIRIQDPNSKIFVLTGHAEHSINKDGVTQIFKKPYDVKQLVLEIQQIHQKNTKVL